MPHELRVCAETERSDYAFLRIFLPAGNDLVTCRMRFLRVRSFRNARGQVGLATLKGCCAWLRGVPERTRLKRVRALLPQRWLRSAFHRRHGATQAFHVSSRPHTRSFAHRNLLMLSWGVPRPAILRRGFARKLFEYAIELREGLESRGECNFANAQTTVLQQITRGRKASAGDVIDKIDTSHLFEILA